MRAVGVIQARLGSTRLPRKILADIEGRPMIRRIIDRLRACETLDDVVISTSDDAQDDELADFAAGLGIGCFRGPVDDIAARMARAADGADAEIIARVWGDCALIDPAVVDLIVAKLIDEELDYATNVMRGDLSFPDGQDVEVYRAATLERLVAETKAPKLREYLQEWVIANRDSLKLGSVTQDQDLSDWHISIDYPEDLEAVRAIYREIKGQGLDNGLAALVDLLRRQPALLKAFSGAPRNIEYQAYLKQTASAVRTDAI